MKDIHRGGRPALNRPDSFYTSLLEEYKTMTLAQMAKVHNVTRTTISRWLKTAREGNYAGQKS